jgi:hypothetical protein
MNSATPTQDNDPLRMRMKKRVVQMKEHLAACIDEHTDPSEEFLVSVALLEMAVDRFIETHGQKDTLEIIDTACCRAGLQVKPALQ